MKKIIISFFVFCTISSFAQTYTISSDTLSESALFIDVQNDQYYVLGVDATLTNNASVIVPSTWNRTVKFLTAGWTTSVCDPVVCWGETTEHEDFIFQADTTAPIIVDFKTNQLSGMGIVKVIFSNQSNSNDFAEAIFIGIVEPGTGVSTVEKIKDIKIFPNPAKDKLMIVAASSMLPTSFEVYDVLGKKIITQITKDGENLYYVDVTSLKGGFYFLRMKFSNGTIVTRQFTKS